MSFYEMLSFRDPEVENKNNINICCFIAKYSSEMQLEPAKGNILLVNT